MARGGARPGAGRKVGQANKINAQAKKAALAGGVTPLQYMLGVMRNNRADTKRRDDMAKAAAPFCHSRAVEHSGRGGGPIATMDLTKATDEQISAIEAIFGPLADTSDGDGGGEGGEGS